MNAEQPGPYDQYTDGEYEEASREEQLLQPLPHDQRSMNDFLDIIGKMTGTPSVPNRSRENQIEAQVPCVSDQPAGEAAVPNSRLIRNLGSSDYRTREAATRELQSRGPSALPDLLLAQGDGDRERRGRAIELIDRLGCSGIPELIAASRSDNTQLRAGAERAMARLATSSEVAVLDYASQSPINLEQARQVLTTRPGWRESVSQHLGHLGFDGEGWRPTTELQLQRAITAAQVMNDPAATFQLSLEEGRLLLAQGAHTRALNSLDRCLNVEPSTRAADPNIAPLRRLDFYQQLNDYLDTDTGRALPATVREAVRLRMDRMIPDRARD